VGTPATPPDRNGPDIDLDLGFGKFVSSKSRRRLLNRDGTFNVRRTGFGFFENVSVYHFLLEISWPGFLALASVSYILANVVFATGYVTLGSGALARVHDVLPAPLSGSAERPTAGNAES
jgi:hypothetical protein